MTLRWLALAFVGLQSVAWLARGEGLLPVVAGVGAALLAGRALRLRGSARPLRRDRIFVTGALLTAGAFFAEGWAPPTSLPSALLESVAHAARFGLPLALIVPRAGVARVLGVSAGLVFVGHGVECWTTPPEFVALLTEVPRRGLGLSIGGGWVPWVLRGIGVVDIGVGLLALHPRTDAQVRRRALMWMTFWGFATAGARLLLYGGGGWPEAVGRVANGGTPWLALRSMRVGALEQH